ncbi:hypothetical protein [Paenibacillus bovis]|uniref:Uncharacterized protein n=1 Tax=Paenibacillus bovis TaxID=1616788 RepID=A0A1X9T4G5_9BACL|nr:hypothetical protein [Paenibacillus bovis]ARR10722.1 hypothetical protein AR543_p0114 [Paenibacillus bovis]
MSTAIRQSIELPNEYKWARKKVIEGQLARKNLPSIIREHLSEELQQIEEDLAAHVPAYSQSVLPEDADSNLPASLDKVFQKVVIDRLYQYKKIKQRQEILKQQINEIEQNMHADMDEIKMTASYGEFMGGSGLPSSQVERAVMAPHLAVIDLRRTVNKNAILIALMEVALGSLDGKQRDFVEVAYLSEEGEMKESAVAAELQISRGTYFTRKKSALYKLAEALHII